MEINLSVNQDPLYLLRKEHEKLTKKLSYTKRWNINRLRKLQQKLNVISESLLIVHDTNNYIMDKITQYDFHYVNKALEL